MTISTDAEKIPDKVKHILHMIKVLANKKYTYKFRVC